MSIFCGADVEAGPKEKLVWPRGEEEYQRFMGWPASLLPWSGDHRAGSREGDGRNYQKLVHPVVWLRWRIAILRRGPYAPDFEEFRGGPSGAP
jgi:hypothetical protein